DYVWLGRALGPRLAWLTNGLVLGFIIENLAYYALIAFAAVFQLESVLPILGINVSLSLPEEISIAIAFFAVIVLANILGTRYGIKLMTVLTIVSLLGLLTAIIILFITPRAQAVSAISSLLPSGYTYSKITLSYSGPSFSMNTMLMLLPFFAIYVYPWLNAGPAIASEIKGRNALRWNVPMAFLFTLIFLTLGFGAMYYSLGFNFITAALSNPDLNGAINFWTIAMAVSSGMVVKWIIGITSVTWYLAILAYGAIVIVRYWFALAFDRVWPSLFAYLSPRFGTPIYAHLFDLTVTAVLVAAAGFLYQTFTAFYGAVVEAIIYYMMVGIAAVLIATLRYSSLSLSDKSRALLAVSGAVMAGIMAYLTYEFLAYPQIWGGNWLAYGVETGAVVLGIAIYLTSRYVNLKKYSIDISVAYAEIPPE
ncbi:MAG: APC family permease, partial [Vulcanisaeta sp.]